MHRIEQGAGFQQKVETRDGVLPIKRSRAEVHMRMMGLLLLVAFLALIALVATSPPRFLYDEPYFANYISLLHRYGVTPTFLNSLPAAPGPLCAFTQVVLEPLTQLQPVRMRFVNVLLLVMVAGMLAVWLRQQNCSDYVVAACSVLVAPMTWALAGMALSEMSAMMFVTLSLYLQLRGLTALERGRRVLGWFLASGISLGIAVWGRQPYLLLSGVPVLLALLERRLRMPALIHVGVVMAFAVPLFIIWKGLVPPSNQWQQGGLLLTHGLISLGYTGICFLLLAPRLRWLPAKVLIGLVVLTAAANASLGTFAVYLVRSVVDRYLPAPAVFAYGKLCGSLFLSCGVAFLVLLLRFIWEGRQDLKLITCNAGLLCVAISPMFVPHRWSTRYAAMSLPYLILSAQPWREWRLKTVMTAVAGCGVGFLSMFEYFSYSR
jgi:NO-binding membrane sensor protein with MHYT domain